ncbi:MAG TPA: ribokinase [Phototrophicaceae bacterium]|nr:ribokinase [Phototrophicaceae bacterium]
MIDRPQICVVGSCNTDLIVRVPRQPEAGETLRGQNFRIGFGGKGANQAVMAARLGAQVSMIGKLGHDTFGENTVANFREQGIDTTYIFFDEREASGVALIEVNDVSGQNSIVVASGANDTLSPDDVRQASAAITSAQILICQLEVPPETTREALRIAREANVTTIFNPAPASVVDDEIMALTDILIPNEVETGMLIGSKVEGDQQAFAAARALQARGAQTVIVTLGSRGALLVEGDQEPQLIVAEKVQAVDTTGAGDAFVGSFAYLLASGRSMIDAANRACAIATRSVLKPGTQSSFPMRADILNLLND